MREYSAADITVLDFDESVRRWPGMYFGSDPHLPTSVLTAVVIASLHPGPKVAPTGPLRDLDARPGTGSTLTYHLDPSFFTRSPLSAPTADLHAAGCCELPGQFHLTS
ncbi:hypothetical protein FB565_008577 [Actinoplanes lutulentus]|uniref:hypothetical protein n=1 Tax=Actinoplanes lutulentus TaxID=1287878 RepID=UPI0011B93B66|nr:hypothetical protein [Actinoplanes lutulentus]MBB2948791.1 hypothetical protein [Actinoplanes lutulentus]